MKPDDEIFADALDLPPAERAAFLDRVCAEDPAQRARIAALLTGQQAAENFLEHPPHLRRAPLPDEQPGDTIDRYVLQRPLGEGGCGTVYLAEQTTPVRRLVALKIIKLGMDTREVIARFEAERQALAMMDHPGIARVFDAGATATGRPYFVMEFVDGLPITRFCDEHHLSTEARLDLFARVCLALQHAHQKGIIHRDVKPSNVLVAMHDGVPSPKIIDFGIAKATQGRLANHTLVTALDQLIGTPAYMSPEQVESREFDIDTRSDIYALGVLLYELLTGRPPYDPKSLVQAGLAEIRRIIREVDPPRPSTRLATLTHADRDTIARLRGTAPVRLTSLLRGDLDWIVMRCLEKDRARRYGAASDLAEDVRRHLRREAVAARPPDLAYRARKFIARHRLACASVAAIATTLILATIVSLVQADRARRAEAVARTERDAARAAQRAEAAARTDAQRRQEQAEELLAFMLGDFRAELKKIGKLALLDAVGDKAMAHFAALDPRDLTDTALTQQAKAITQIGEIRLDQARYAEATQSFEAAHQRTTTLVTRNPGNATGLFERAQAEFWLGLTARRRGDLPAARTWLARYRDSALALAAQEPTSERTRFELIHSHHNLAVLEFDAGELAAARTGFEASAATLRRLAAERPADLFVAGRLADTTSWLGSVAERDGRLRDALQHFTTMAAAYEALVRQEPSNAEWQRRRAEAASHLATAHTLLGETAPALRAAEESLRLFAALVGQDSSNQEWEVAWLRVRLQLAALHLATAAPAPAQPLILDSCARLEELARAEPGSRTVPRLLVAALRLRATVRPAASSASDADLAQAADLAVSLIQSKRADLRTRWEYARVLLQQGDRSTATGDLGAARAFWERALAAVSPDWHTSRDWRALDPAQRALAKLGRTAEAAEPAERLRQAGYARLE